MKIVLVHGQNHEGSSCHIGRMLADLLIFTTPAYCMAPSAPMKALIDLTFTCRIRIGRGPACSISGRPSSPRRPERGRAARSGAWRGHCFPGRAGDKALRRRRTGDEPGKRQSR